MNFVFIFLPYQWFYKMWMHFITREDLMWIYIWRKKLTTKQCVLNFSLEKLIIVKIIPFYDVVYENKVLFVRNLPNWKYDWVNHYKKGKANSCSSGCHYSRQLGILAEEWALKWTDLGLNPPAYKLYDLGWIVNVSDH